MQPPSPTRPDQRLRHQGRPAPARRPVGADIDETIALANGTVQKVVNAKGSSSLKGNGTAALFGSSGLLAPVFDALNKVVNVALGGKLQDTRRSSTPRARRCRASRPARSVWSTPSSSRPPTASPSPCSARPSPSSTSVLPEHRRPGPGCAQHRREHPRHRPVRCPRSGRGRTHPVTSAVQNLLNQLIPEHPGQRADPEPADARQQPAETCRTSSPRRSTTWSTRSRACSRASSRST